MKRPENCDSIDELIREGKECITSYIIAHGAFGPPEPEPGAYFQRALDLLQQSDLEDHDRESKIRSQLGWYLGARGKFEAGIEQMEAAQVLKPDTLNTKLTLAQMHHLQAENGPREHQREHYAAASKAYAHVARLVSFLSFLKYELIVNAVRDQLLARRIPEAA